MTVAVLFCVNCCKMSEQQRRRSCNFTAVEKRLLLQLISERKIIIENKKSNSYTWKEKDKVWNDITIKFNVQYPQTIKRTKEQLKKLYENIKKTTRRTVSAQKKELLRQSGGGVTIKEDNLELALSIINEKTVCGLQNEYDRNGVMVNEMLEPKINEHEIKLEVLTEDIPSSSSAEQLDSYTTPQLRNKSLTQSLRSSLICSKYEDLAKVKTDLAAYSLEKMKEEREERKLEHKLRMEVLYLEKQIKEEELRQLYEKKRHYQN